VQSLSVQRGAQREVRKYSCSKMSEAVRAYKVCEHMKCVIVNVDVIQWRSYD